MTCPVVVGLFESVVQCELPAGHVQRGQPVHTATVYAEVGNRSVPVIARWIHPDEQWTSDPAVDYIALPSPKGRRPVDRWTISD